MFTSTRSFAIPSSSNWDSIKCPMLPPTIPSATLSEPRALSVFDTSSPLPPASRLMDFTLFTLPTCSSSITRVLSSAVFKVNVIIIELLLQFLTLRYSRIIYIEVRLSPHPP